MKKIVFLLTALIFTGVLYAQTTNPKEMEQKVDQIISKLTLKEKVALCSGRDDWSTQPIERLGISWIWLSDGPHGLRRAPATNKPGYGDQLPAICFPTASALAASWDLDLVNRVGKALGEESQAQNVHVLLGPGVNIKRSVLGGRNFEYFSEDPILSGEMGAAYINGVQSMGVGTSLKHFVANNVETMRMFNNSNVDMRTLHEIYLRSFEIAVKKSQPWTIMACYNRVQGEYGTQSAYLLTEVLRKQWGYEGVVISDWFAVVDHVKAIKAGLNIEMPHVSDVNDKVLVDAVKSGDLDEKLIDNLVKQVLLMVFKAKELEVKNATFDKNEHHKFARSVAAQTITLLKNDANTLPVSTSKYKTIAIIGEFANNLRYQGNGSSEVKPTQLDKVLDMVRAEYGSNYKIEYAQGYSLKNDNDLNLIDAAVKVAKKADIALVFAGLPLSYESEGIDRKHIDMPLAHNKLIEAVASVQKNTTVVLTNGSAVTMPWLPKVKAVVEAWLGGQAGAGAVTDVLFGKINPSGKLAETFPARLEDTPAFFNFPGEQGDVLYGERIFVGYRYYDLKKIEPLFPFGHGLSYTTFEYSNLKLSAKKATDKDGLEVNFVIKNTGSVDGKEVVQLYVSDKESSLMRPKQELKKFAKIKLKAGEEKTITFQLNSRDFSFFDGQRSMWIAESGDFEIRIGASSRNIKLTESFTLQSTQNVPVMASQFTFFKQLWQRENTRALLIQLMPKWIKNFTPKGKELNEANFPGFMVDHPMVKYPYITNGEVTQDDIKNFIEKCNELTYKP